MDDSKIQDGLFAFVLIFVWKLRKNIDSAERLGIFRIICVN